MEDKKLVIAWLKTLVASMISGAAHSVVVLIVDPLSFNFGDGLSNVGKVVAASAIFSACLYLAKSPLPGYNNQQP